MVQMIGDAISQAGANFVDALTRLLPRLVTTFIQNQEVPENQQEKFA